MEQETFWTLLRDLPHWEFELFLIFIFDVLIGLIIWPLFQRFTKHHKDDDDKLEALEKRIEQLEKR
ncbi:MAG: hypothetical protein JWL80_476 [Parcubacteria group bacterium]|nr:hypothetical protein [Parcubacteria group bacterium]